MAQLIALDIPAPHGILEGLLRLPDAAPDGSPTSPKMAAVVCHPHPLGGGTMHNKVVFRVAQALCDLGMPTLRFNFRGVGRSTGVHDSGRGEGDDVRAALDTLAARYPGVPLCLGGFSFGSWVGLPIGAADPRVRQLIGVGVPVSSLAVDTLIGSHKSKLIVQGANDEYGQQADLQTWFARLAPPKQLTIIPGADHFFTNQQPQLYDAVVAYFRSGASALGTVS
ncbi:MAG TPA: alpha/beta family hydrolase [Ktedonobacterales bacterium]|nr:alpha/beta family hydrolase [Ktedonobacterales bacterium]